MKKQHEIVFDLYDIDFNSSNKHISDKEQQDNSVVMDKGVNSDKDLNSNDKYPAKIMIYKKPSITIVNGIDISNKFERVGLNEDDDGSI